MPAVRRAGFWGNRTPVRERSSGLSSHRAADGHLAAGANPSPEVLSREVRSACGPSIRHTCTVDRRPLRQQSAREAPNVIAQAGAARETLPGGGTRGVPGRHERHARGQAISRAGGEGGIPPSALRVKARRTRARRLGSPGKADGLRRREDRPPVQVRRLSGPQLT